MDRWDKKESKDDNLTKFDKAVLNLNTKIDSYIPKPLKGLLRSYAMFMHKHGIKLALKTYYIFLASIVFTIMFITGPIFGTIPIYSSHNILDDTSFTLNLNFFVDIGLYILFLCIVPDISSGGGGGGKGKSKPSDSKDSSKELYSKSDI